MALPIQIVGFLLHPPSEEVVDVLKSIYGPAHIIIFVSWVFALLGLPGLYARQAHRAGVLGLIGFVLTMLAAAYHFYLVLYEAYATPLLAKETATQALIGPGGPLAHGAGALGPLAFALILAFPLFGIATVRAGVLPRGSGWLQIVCVPVFFLGMILLPPEVQARLPGVATPIAMQYYLLFLGYAWGGYALWTEKERLPASMAQMEEPQPAA
jgi:hypothetical protein